MFKRKTSPALGIIAARGLTACALGGNGAGADPSGASYTIKFGNVISAGDTQDQKLCVMQVPLHIAFWESIGASQATMAFPEVFTALQQGVVDGVENPRRTHVPGKVHRGRGQHHLPRCDQLITAPWTRLERCGPAGASRPTAPVRALDPQERTP